MKKILIGNDINLKWVIKNKEKQPINLVQSQILIKILHQEIPEAAFIPPFSVNSNEISICFPAEKQKHLGIYHLQLTLKDERTVKIVNRETFCLSDIYDTEIHSKLTEENGEVQIEVIHVENEVSIVDGKNGKSAYEIALSHGFTGTEEEWLSSLSQNLQQVWEKGRSIKTANDNHLSITETDSPDPILNLSLTGANNLSSLSSTTLRIIDYNTGKGAGISTNSIVLADPSTNSYMDLSTDNGIITDETTQKKFNNGLAINYGTEIATPNSNINKLDLHLSVIGNIINIQFSCTGVLSTKNQFISVCTIDSGILPLPFIPINIPFNALATNSSENIKTFVPALLIGNEIQINWYDFKGDGPIFIAGNLTYSTNQL